MVEGSYSHVGNNFALTFHDESLRDVQPMYERTAVAGLWARSYTESVYVRPTDSIDLMGKNLAEESYRPSQSTRSRPREFLLSLRARF